MKLLGSEPGFLTIRVTAVDWRDDGTEPEERVEWMMVGIRDDREGRQALIRGVGRGQVDRWMI